ncbi:hypothetical protein AB0O00_29770, partial [Kitasatospora sp. NPDC093558]
MTDSGSSDSRSPLDAEASELPTASEASETPAAREVPVAPERLVRPSDGPSAAQSGAPEVAEAAEAADGVWDVV